MVEKIEKMKKYIKCKKFLLMLISISRAHFLPFFFELSGYNISLIYFVFIKLLK
jgi:hypothetical protein